MQAEDIYIREISTIFTVIFEKNWDVRLTLSLEKEAP